MAEDTRPMIKVQTTLPRAPFPGNAARAAIRTARLVIRPLGQGDLEALHGLRTQREVMARTALGRVDADVAETQAKLDPFLPPRDADTYNPGIYLAATGELVGLGGVFSSGGGGSSVLGWPEVGYMIRREHWGRGYTTEFLRAFVKDWWALPRREAEVVVDARSVEGPGGGRVPEMLCAVVEDSNAASLRVMEKAGFRRFTSWKAASRRPGTEGEEVTLVGFVTARPEEAA